MVLIHGARQTGKSTLAQALVREGFPGWDRTARYLTLDDATLLAAAQTDPDGLVRSLQRPAVLDEVQRAPDLFRAIKARVDEDRRPGQFLLTGSANVFLLPTLSESLAGRMEVVTLWPFSQGELEGRKEGFVDAVFDDDWPPDQGSGGEGSGPQPDVWSRVLRGGYPEAVERATPRRRRAWFNAYVTTILQRDVRDLANVEGLTQMPRLLRLLAARVSSLLNVSEVSRALGLPNTTLRRYLTLLEATFLVRTLPAWSTNGTKRLVRSPKLLLADTGLAAQLLGLGKDAGSPAGGSPLRGALLENFMAMELAKQITWSERQPSLSHFRTRTGREVDLVLEDATGAIVGVEVKAATSVSGGDLKGLRALEEAAKEQFQRGVVLYGGDEVVAFGPRLWALPVGAVWGW